MRSSKLRTWLGHLENSFVAAGDVAAYGKRLPALVRSIALTSRCPASMPRILGIWRGVAARVSANPRSYSRETTRRSALGAHF
jgi:hypothetical protein